MIKATVGEEKGPSHDKPYEQKGVVKLFFKVKLHSGLCKDIEIQHKNHLRHISNNYD